MIITRTPLRISFCGGGTDIPVYSKKHGGCVINTSIDKYIYITSAKSFNPEVTQLKYSVVEKVNDYDQIKHPIFRECLKKYDIKGVEINSTADVPSGTGLGSSSSFTVGLLNLMRVATHKDVSKEILASEACDVEINRLGEPVGMQDQYAAAYGGLNYYKFNPDGSVETSPIKMSLDDKAKMFSNILIFYLGGTRSASKILENDGYKVETTSSEQKKDRLKELTNNLRRELENGNIDYLGKNLDEGWKLKRSLAKGISNDMIDSVYDKAMENGAVGGKLLGAGGNGFMLFYVNSREQEAVKSTLSDLKRFDIKPENNGSVVIYNDEI